MMLIIESMRAFVVSPGLGCIPTMKVELTAENMPACFDLLSYIYADIRCNQRTKVKIMSISSLARSRKSLSCWSETFLYVAQNFDSTSPPSSSAIVDPRRTSRICSRVFDLWHAESNSSHVRGRLIDAYIFLASALSMSTSGSPFIVCVFCAKLDMGGSYCTSACAQLPLGEGPGYWRLQVDKATYQQSVIR